jgi:protein phosphatase
VRANNEDAVAVDREAQVAVLADGMGGYNAGEIASGMAITYIGTEMSRWLCRDYATLPRMCGVLELCVENANHAIWALRCPTRSTPAWAPRWWWAFSSAIALILGHIGDSRCYRLRAGVLQQITRDHSWLQEQVDAGILTREQAAASSNRNLVTARWVWSRMCKWK